MNERAQFTFYRSYYEAIRRLGAEEQAEILLAICGYALDGMEPEAMSPIAETVFTLVKPTLDSGWRKASNGKTGGEAKQTGSKQKAKRKQTPSKKEKEGEKEVENECSPPIAPKGAFERFWSAYPKKVGKAAAKKAFGRVNAPVETLLSAIDRQKCSDQWSRDNGQYIPNPATWLNQGRWEDELAGEKPPEHRGAAELARYLK